MKNSFLLILLFPFFASAQIQTLQNAHTENVAVDFNPTLKPFYHGVASGDPLQNSVIIWTRVTPDSGFGGTTISGTWKITTDTAMTNLITQGNFTTDSSKDFTVKIDIQGLAIGTTYYYQFESNGKKSLVGRTKTLPVTNVNRLKFGVVSCSNYEAGFFNAYAAIGNRNDLDAVLHLGDYIYEYRAGTSSDSAIGRFHENFETVTKAQYRARYSLYRLDPDLCRAHQQHPFIHIWDDHETANDAWKDGAQNHQPATEGPWAQRKSAANQVFFEWLPIRENAKRQIYRTFDFGNLAKLTMLDTRLEGRQQQLNSVTNPSLNDTARTMLGDTQLTWFENELQNSGAVWNLIGNQVLFAQFNIGWAGPIINRTPEQMESIFLDIWDGYPAERQRIIQFLNDNQIDNTIFLTGDFHSSFAFDIADTVVDENNNYAPIPNYNQLTGAGSSAVEFATPSITSANFDERLDTLPSFTVTILELQINDTLQQTNTNPNPHMKYVDLDRHGYIILDVNSDSVKANFYYINTLKKRNSNEKFGTAWMVKNGENKLAKAKTESAPKTQQDIPAPLHPSSEIGMEEFEIQVFAIYPNPASEVLNLQIGMERWDDFQAQILSMDGKVLKEFYRYDDSGGIYEVQVDISEIPKGAYILQIKNGSFKKGFRFVKAP